MAKKGDECTISFKKVSWGSKIGNLAMEIANDIDMSAFDIGSSSECEPVQII